jgi:type II secretory pathway pseudopilin PulG
MKRAVSFSPGAAGFTLIEVLLALLLSTALLAGLWAALEISMRMFESGRTRVEEAQLARALLHQLDADLRQTLMRTKQPAASEVLAPIAPTSTSQETSSDHSSTPSSIAGILPLSRGMGPIPALPADALGGKGRFESPRRKPGLSGTPHTLRLDVYRTLPGGSAAGRHRDVTSVDALELRTVFYLLARAQEAERPAIGEPSYAGDALVRYETYWLDAPGDQLGSSVASRQLSPQDQLFEEFLTLEDRYEAATRDTFGAALNENPAEEFAMSPEVVRLEFRYFDGVEWLSSWDSEAAGRLPSAVEIVLSLQPMATSRSVAKAADTLSETESFQPQHLPTVRLVVQLPNGTGAPDSDPVLDETEPVVGSGGAP